MTSSLRFTPKARPMIQVAIDLAVLPGLRRGDLLALTKNQLKDDGVHVHTSKTGRGLIIEYTPELSAVLERAKLMKPHFRQPLIATRAGKAFTRCRLRNSVAAHDGRRIPEGARGRSLRVQRSSLQVGECHG